MSKLGKSLVVVICVIAAVVIIGGASYLFGMKRERYREDFYVEQGTVLDVYNTVGAVNISGWDRDYIEVIAEKQSLLGLFMDDVSIEVTEGDRFVVRSQYDTIQSRMVGVEYNITVPEHVLVGHIETSTGSIQVYDVTGDVDAKTSTGSVDLDRVTGFVRATTSTGSVSIARVSGVFAATTSTGSITVEVHAISESLRISSSTGSVTVSLDPRIDAHIEARSSTGKISHKELPLIISESDNRKLVARMGEGKGRISISTSTGSIELKALILNNFD